MHNARNRRAATYRPPAAFPAEVLIPPHRGASVCAAELPPPTAPGPAPKKCPPRKRAAIKRKKKKPAQRRRKAAAKPRAPVPVIVLPRLSEPLVEPAIDLSAWSALASPPAKPTPAGSLALATYRSGGLLVAVADWLGSQTLLLWRRLGELGRPAPKRPFRARLTLRRRVPPEDELTRLRAENARLHRQLEALIALQSGGGGSQAASLA